ncbi:MAG: hypothetical protein Q7V58_05090 [Actinomycetota bacterium]|nr:hypothetical protein [Actinomycetota bacterium]
MIVPRPGDDQSDVAWSRRLARLAAGQHGILSDEKLLGSPFDAYAQAHPRAGLMRKALGGREFQVIVYTRPQPEWLASVYLQGVQQGRLDQPEEFWARVADAPLLQWSAMVDLLEQESGAARVVVRAYGGDRDVVADFSNLCGFKVNVTRPAIRDNVSIAAIQAPLLLALNSDPSLTTENRNQLRHVFQNVLRPGAPMGWSAFPAPVVQAIRDCTHADWARLTARVAATDPAEGERFARLDQVWRQPLLPFPGTGLEGPGAREEMIRSLAVLANATTLPQRSLVSRLGRRLRAFARRSG